MAEMNDRASTLARLCFWVPAERRDDFGAAYEKRVASLLEKHGLVESSALARATVEGVFGRLFACESPAAFVSARENLWRDPAWQDLLRRLGTDFQAADADGFMRCRFAMYECPAGTGQSAAAGAGTRRGEWLTLGVQDGLPSALLQSVLADREGCLWFGAETGLTRYDGERFVTYDEADGLASSGVFSMLEDRQEQLWGGVFSMLEDRQGQLWFGTGNGLTRYDGERFVTYDEADGLVVRDVFSMLEDRQGQLWFGCKTGLIRYDGQSFQTFTPREGLADGTVVAIAEDREGCLWLGVGRWDGNIWSWVPRGIFHYDGQSFQTATAPDGLFDRVGTSIYQDRAGHLWFGGMGEVARYDGRDFQMFTSRDGLVGGHIGSIREDRDGHLWFGSLHQGISRFDGRTFATFTTENGLFNSQVCGTAVDRDGNLWVGTTGGGASRYEGAHFTSFTPRDGLPNAYAKCVVRDRCGQLWVGTGAGLTRYDGEGFIAAFTAADGLAADMADYVVEDWDGNLWIGNNMGQVTRYDPSRKGHEAFTAFTVGDPLGQWHQDYMTVDRRGHVWLVGSAYGAGRYDGTRWRVFTTEDGLLHNEVRSIAEDRAGNLWFGTGGGVTRYCPSETGDGTFTSLTREDGLELREVDSILEDRAGYLWFGSVDGLVTRYDPSETGDAAFTTFALEDGLKPGLVLSIIEDRRGHFWFGIFGGGIVRYDGLVFQDLHHRDGLIADTVQQVFEDDDGFFWIPTDSGLTRYRPSATRPAVRIREVTADRSYGAVEEVALPVSQRLVQFSFQGRSLSTPADRMAYVYRLRGYEDEWQSTRQRRVRYAELGEGEYVFEVKAVDRDLHYSEAVRVRVRVEPDARLEGLAEALRQSGPAGEFVGASEALRQVVRQLRQVAPTDATVLILGETGTGKGLAARTLHELSERQAGPFITVPCGGLPEGLVESELFGHEKGAFTGAIRRKLGKVELAAGGTLFLDEIGDLPLAAQVKLLRLLEERTFERVGGTRELTSGARVVAATNRDLQRMVAEGTFREDLFFRLQVVPVVLPPLRQRREDVPLLTTYFVQRMATHLSKPVRRMAPAALARLQGYDWPGNVRELEHVVHRAVIMCPGEEIQAGEILLNAERPSAVPVGPRLTPEEYERQYFQEALESADWVVGGPEGAAARLGMAESSLRFRLKKLGLKRP